MSIFSSNSLKVIYIDEGFQRLLSVLSFIELRSQSAALQNWVSQQFKDDNICYYFWWKVRIVNYVLISIKKCTANTDNRKGGLTKLIVFCCLKEKFHFCNSSKFYQTVFSAIVLSSQLAARRQTRCRATLAFKLNEIHFDTLDTQNLKRHYCQFNPVLVNIWTSLCLSFWQYMVRMSSKE